MADNTELGPLPNGWECKYDHRTRRYYFINYVNKTTTWDDPRARLQMMMPAPPPYSDTSDLIPQPQLHGTPDHRNIYPSYPAHYHPQPAFQMPNPYMQEVQRQEMNNLRPSPVPSRVHTAPLMGSHAIGHHNNSKMQETSFNNPLATEQSVAKISAMFPTVAETHVRALLIKYHNREALVISALQVEKNPITTPGPFSTPPLARHIIIPPSALPPNYHYTPPSGLRDCCSTPPPSLYSCGIRTIGTGGGTLTGSPASSSYLGSPSFRQSPRPHSSPKMKLRYMKNMFPKADETIILDTLYNVDNNVQAATNQLQAMGFDKRDVPPSRAGTPLKKLQEEDKKLKEEEIKVQPVTPLPSVKSKSIQEKEEICNRLKRMYPDLVDHLISMALDSVDFEEKKASHILDLMIKEESTLKSTPSSASSTHQPDNSRKTNENRPAICGAKTTVQVDITPTGDQKLDSSEHSRSDNIEEPSKISSPPKTSPQPTEKSHGRKVGSRKDIPKVSRGTSTTEDKEYRSPYRLTIAGPNSALHTGPNDEILLENYVTWTGPTVQTGNWTSLAKGPDKTLLKSQKYCPKGPNRESCKGPKPGLSKGSVYSHLAESVARIAESRGK